MIDKIKSLIEKLQWSHVAIILALVVAFFYFTLDRSEMENREQAIGIAASEIANLEKKLNEAREFEKQFDEKKRKLAELTNELQKSQGALPRQLFLPDLLSDLLREAKQLEIDVSLIKADEVEKPMELYSSLGFTIEARGTFLQFFIFLDRLAHMKRLLTLETISLEKDTSHPAVTLGGEEGAFAGSRLTGGRSVYPGIRGSMRIVTYRYKAPPPVVPAGPGAKGAAK